MYSLCVSVNELWLATRFLVLATGVGLLRVLASKQQHLLLLLVAQAEAILVLVLLGGTFPGLLACRFFQVIFRTAASSCLEARPLGHVTQGARRRVGIAGGGGVGGVCGGGGSMPMVTF